MSKQLWDGKQQRYKAPCTVCGAENLLIEGVIDPDGPQVYVFCAKCDFRQPMISREPQRRQTALSAEPPCCCVP